jgi:hypothetical protein
VPRWILWHPSHAVACKRTRTHIHRPPPALHYGMPGRCECHGG